MCSSFTELVCPGRWKSGSTHDYRYSHGYAVKKANYYLFWMTCSPPRAPPCPPAGTGRRERWVGDLNSEQRHHAVRGACTRTKDPQKGMTSAQLTPCPQYLDILVLVVHGTRLSRSVEKRFHSRLPLLSRLRRKKGQLLFILDDVLATARTPVPARSQNRERTDTAATAAGVHVVRHKEQLAQSK